MGEIGVGNIGLGTYTITETVPTPGYLLVPNPSRTVTVTAAAPNVVMDVTADDASVIYAQLGSITCEKRDAGGNFVALAGATFTISPNPLPGGAGTYTVV